MGPLMVSDHHDVGGLGKINAADPLISVICALSYCLRNRDPSDHWLELYIVIM